MSLTSSNKPVCSPRERGAIEYEAREEAKPVEVDRGGPDAIFGQSARLTGADRARYVRTCMMCEFMTSVASAAELSGGLNESLSDRMYDLIEPVRAARDWMQHIGRSMVRSEPLPSRVGEALEIAEYRVLDALPELKALIDEACEDLAGGAERPRPARDGVRPKSVTSKPN